jgi:hypothetical protein
MIFGVEGVDPDRRAALIRLLDIDLYQRLTTMSDGQRRRVQIAMGLLKPYDVRAGFGRRGWGRGWGQGRLQGWGGGGGGYKARPAQAWAGLPGDSFSVAAGIASARAAPFIPHPDRQPCPAPNPYPKPRPHPHPAPRP